MSVLYPAWNISFDESRIQYQSRNKKEEKKKKKKIFVAHPIA